MTIDFYDLLEIDKDATQEEIKAAYRRLSMEHHPDRGGDRDQFELIKKAYETLSNEERRERYDTTGMDEDFFSLAVNMAVAIFKQAMRSDPVNISEEINETIRDAISDSDNKIEMFQDQIKKHERMVSKIKSSPKNDFIKSVIAQENQAIELQIQQVKTHKQTQEAAWELLKGYEFEVEERIPDSNHIRNDYMRDAMNYALHNMRGGRFS